MSTNEEQPQGSDRLSWTPWMCHITLITLIWSESPTFLISTFPLSHSSLPFLSQLLLIRPYLCFHIQSWGFISLIMLLFTYGGSKRSPVACWEDNSSPMLSFVMPSLTFICTESEFPLPLFSIQSPFQHHGGPLSGAPAPKSPDQPGSVIKLPRHSSIMRQW